MPHKKGTKKRKSASRVRLADIAQAAGVSRGVAGQVLNGGKGNSRVAEATAQRIMEVARQMNYRPNPAAQQLKGMRTRMFGTLVASAGDPLRSFLVQHLDTESVKAGYHTIIGNTIGREDVGPDQFEYYTEELARRAVDGVFCAVHNWFQGDRKALAKRHPNAVFFEDPGFVGAHVVKANRYIAARLASRHLLERGRRRIALIISDLKKPTCQERLRGFRDEHQAYGKQADDRLVFNGAEFGQTFAWHDTESHTWKFPDPIVDTAIDRLVRDLGADALVCNDDFWAASILRRLHARGVTVPAHVAVVGYLNHYLADWTDPPLTSIDTRQDVAAERMLKLMEHLVTQGPLPEEDRVVEITPKLIVRGSS